ncbi:MAG: hypothetical protein ACXWCS_27430, partial [Burkholderiales bacterium]
LNQLQSAPGRPANMAPTDTLRLDQLQLRQRMQQQQLEQQQLQRQRINPTFDHRDVLQQQRFAEERQLQLQQFDMEQRELMRTMKPQPLQRPPSGGQLQP